ncbi:putative protein C9orf85 [Liparis tanakae]|uniref:Uncharacterized protein n=1 Tax=Liparis tanakae TaxID=230148 RepID=A0A4Z2I8G9_9TELE|nr:putative protein C9orf85 [Liparis tanakae]
MHSNYFRKAKSKIHDGLCLHCKGVLEWRVQYNKYKTLTQPKKCVKCSQKTVKDAYHIICKPCSLELDICSKCGKKEDIVIPINSKDQKEEAEKEDEEEEVKGDDELKKKGSGRGKKDSDDLDSDDNDDDDDDLSEVGDDDKGEDCASDSEPKKT